MTTLMLQELSSSQIDELENRARANENSVRKDHRWNPEPKPSTPAVMPWWQKKRNDDSVGPGEVKDALWRKIAAG